MKEITLTKGMIALVDDEDYPALSNYTWRALKDGQVWYARMSFGSKKFQRGLLMHRVILQIDNPKIICDHIDGNGLNNQKSNLRICTNTENGFNRRRKVNSTIKFKGVQYKKKHKKYSAALVAFGEYHWGGHFDTDIEAAKKYNEMAIKYHGEFAKLNVL